MVEGLNLTARKITVDGFVEQEYYEISGKLTEETWGDLAKNIKARGRAGKIEFELGGAGDGHYTEYMVTTSAGNRVTLDGYKMMTPDGASLEVYGDYIDKRLYGFGGYFRARVPVTGNSAADTQEMNAILDRAGLSTITANPTAADELLLKKSRLAW
jgi:hypothetical protein